MTQSRLIELSYYDPSAQVRLSAYADTVVLDHNSKGGIISAVRFGGYPEMVRAMSDAIYGGATIEATQNSTTRMLQSNVKGYQRQMSHDGVYAVATLMASDDAQTDDRASEGDGEVEGQEAMQPRKCYIFCPQGDRDRLFEELDHKTAAPLIPAFRDYVLDALQKRGDLRQLEVISLKEKMDAWVLDLKPEDRNVVEVLETGLKNGSIQIPGAIPGAPDGFDGVENVTGYLNTFGVTVADRIRHQFMPLFDPANEPLSDEVLAINDCIMNRAGYSLYDAQLAVAEAVKRQLDRKSVALIIAECGAGKTKIGSTALGALHGLWAAQKRSGADKSFGIIMCPSHVTRKWVREIGETLPDTYAMVVRLSIDAQRHAEHFIPALIPPRLCRRKVTAVDPHIRRQQTAGIGDKGTVPSIVVPLWVNKETVLSFRVEDEQTVPGSLIVSDSVFVLCDEIIVSQQCAAELLEPQTWQLNDLIHGTGVCLTPGLLTLQFCLNDHRESPPITMWLLWLPLITSSMLI